MAEVTVEKKVCSGCGAEVREDTLFCYNCGSPIADEDRAANTTGRNGRPSGATVEATAALGDLEKKLEKDTAAEDKLARAARERRKARVGHRKPRKVVWQPVGNSSQGLILLLAIAVTLISFVVVLLTVVWK